MRPAVLRDAVADSDADAFVHVAADDPTRRYLVGSAGGPRRDAVVFADDDLILCPAPGATPDFAGPVRAASDAPPGERAVAALDDRGVSGPVLAPESIPHGPAVRVESAGYELAATDAVEDARAAKDDAERREVAAAGAAVVAGLDAARNALADEPTAAALRREVAVAVVRAGADPVDVTVSAPTEPPAPADPITVRLCAAVAGYHAAADRTIVADPAGGWERRAHVAAQGALAGVKRQLDAGTTPAAARREAVAELGAYGFEDVSAAVHGLGLARRERPVGGAEIAAGAVLAITLAATHADAGTVRLGDTVVVGDETTTLTDASTALPP